MTASSITDPADAARRLEELAAENKKLREQLRAKSEVAAKALATYQQRVLQMEQHAAKLIAANEEIKLVNSKLSQTLKILEEKDRRISEDLDQARSFQQRILPVLPVHDRLRFASFYRPAEVVGGDIYDVSAIGPGRFRVFAADATGHGVQAALRTMILKSEYDRLKTTAPDPAELLEELNRRITRHYPGLSLHCSASCFEVVAAHDAPVTLRYATCAHPPLWHVRGESVDEVYQPGPFLGMVDEIELSAVELTLEPGDRLYTYSDGLIEQWSPDGEAFSGEEAQRVLAARDVDVAGAVERLVACLFDFLGDRGLADDAMLVGIEVSG